MSTLPLIFRGDKLHALVVGGGEVALRKLEALLTAGATVTVVAVHAIPELRELCDKNPPAHLELRPFRAGELSDASSASEASRPFNLVVAATDDRALNAAISREAQALSIPVNVVDVPELCTAYFAAVVNDPPLQFAISTGGAAPFLAKAIKQDASALAARWSKRVRWGAAFRDWVKSHVPETSAREQMYARFLASSDPVLAAWDHGNPPAALWQTWADEISLQHTGPS